MAMNIAAGWDGFTEVALYVIIFGFLWRSLQAVLSDSSVGKAMAFIY